MRVADYTRLSKVEDLSNGKPSSTPQTARQHKDCLALAKLRGWKIVESFTDVDLSAYRKGVARPGFEDLLRAVRNREIDGVLVWKLDRLVRRSAEFERFWSECEKAGVFLASATEPIDTTTELGMVIVRILVAFAQMESATMSLRIRRAKEDAARAGRPASGRRPFGLTSDWKQAVPEEARLIREAADRLIAGDSLRSICNDWNRAGIATVGGGPWKTSTLRYVMMRPLVVGDREHRGEIIASDVFPAALDRFTYKRVVTVLSDPSRRTPHHGRQGLLTPVLRCGRCGASMHFGVDTRGKDRYSCRPQPNGCNASSCLAEPLDSYVTRTVFDRLGGTSFTPSDNGDGSLTAELAEVEAAIAELARDYYVDRRISRAAYDSSAPLLEARKERLERQMARVRRADAAGQLASAADVGAAWGLLTVERRRAVIVDLIEKVTVMPVGRGGRRVPGSAQTPIVWRV